MSSIRNRRWGSPPRVRGTPDGGARGGAAVGLTPAGAGNTVVIQQRHLLGGLTPAGAGNTPPRSCTARRCRAHPRGCGEHSATRRPITAFHGSPPRVRGTLASRTSAWRRLRLTPAGAGNTRTWAAALQSFWAHPRGCGEHGIASDDTTLARGSPPRVRGTRHVTRPGGARRGLTPAGAGNTARAGWSARPGRAHPRGCGEHRAVWAAGVGIMGSPPRVRGTPGDVSCRGVYPGLTPAGAGNTRTVQAAGEHRAAHPRGCGEHDWSDTRWIGIKGSPPRVRGTRDGRLHAAAQQRLTPAGAGNTACLWWRSSWPWAHPRGCGEHGAV